MRSRAASDSVCRTGFGVKMTLWCCSAENGLPPEKQVPAGTPKRRGYPLRHQCDGTQTNGDARDIRFCIPIAWEEYFDVLLKTHEEQAHMFHC